MSRSLFVFIVSVLAIHLFAFSPSFFAPYDFGVADRLKSLSSAAGPGWREESEKNRSLDLHKRYGDDLTLAVQDISLKYAGTNSLDTSKVPLYELGEIVEASFRGGINTESYAWALLRNFFKSDIKVTDTVVAAKILASIDKNLAGVTPKDSKGETVYYAPYWRITPFQSGSYRTPLPGNGYFESKWSYSMGECSYDVRTSAKRIDCKIGIALFLKVYNVTVNGEDVDFNSSSFTAIPDINGVAKIKIHYSWTGKKKKKAKL